MAQIDAVYDYQARWFSNETTGIIGATMQGRFNKGTF